MPTLFRPAIGRLGAILALGMAVWVTAGVGRAIADDPSGCDCGCSCGSEPLPRTPWYFSTDGVAMQRLPRGLGPVATEGASPTGSVALSQQDLADPFAAGTRVLLGHTFDDSPYQVEISYLWLSTTDTSAQVTDPTNNLFSPFTQFGAAPNNNVDYNSSVAIREVSRLESGEINLKYTLPLPAGDPTITLMFGVRHVGIREEFDYLSQPAKNSANPVVVYAHTNNNLWGPQIGGLVEYGRQGVWLRVEGKGALCDNEADRDLQGIAGGVNATHPRLSESNTAMVADIAATVVWRPTAALEAKIGYQATWCDQVALATSNFATDVTSLTSPAVEPSINLRGVIYHGPFAGLQLNW